jgi:hypothetical protein
VEPRRAAVGGSRLPAPPAFAPAESRKLADPFAKPGKKAVAGIPGEGLVRAWRRARRGLGWVRLALFLFLIPWVGLAGIVIAETFGVKLPSEDPGYLKIPGLSADTEIKAGVVLIPAALGLVAWTIGLFGVSNAPRSSFAKGLATAAAVAGLIALLGATAVAAPTGVQLAQGFVPNRLLPDDDPNGIAQRVGIVLALIFGLLSEVWFLAALGRMGAALHDVRLGSRATRLQILVGLVAVAAAVVGLIAVEDRTASAAEALMQGRNNVERPVGGMVYLKDVRSAFDQHVQPQWDKLADQDLSDGKQDFNYKPAAVWGLVALVGLVFWLMYARLVGAGRRAIREWLDQNEPAA